MHKKHKRNENRRNFLRRLAELNREIARALTEEELEILEFRLFTHLFHHRF